MAEYVQSKGRSLMQFDLRYSLGLADLIGAHVAFFSAIIEAHYHSGVLKLKFPKGKHAENAKRITVKAA